MKKLFQEITSALSAGSPVELVSIMESGGSTPRGVGAMMAIFADGHSCGTIGGGNVEFASQKLAAELLKQQKSEVHHFRFVPGDAASLGMVCGGDVTVQLRFLPAGDESTLTLSRQLVTAIEENSGIWLVMDTEGTKPLRLATAADACHDNISFPTGLLRQYPTSMDGWVAVPVVQSGRVYLFGGGHVSQALAPVLTSVGFQCVVYDDRAEFSDPALFPQGTTTICDSFDHLEQHIQLTGEDYAVIMTRGHQADYDVLTHVLRSEAKYIGCIGSRRKLALCRERLLDVGFTAEEYARVYAPIGLNIGAETPAEIAISIAAELIAIRAGRNPRQNTGSLSST